MTVKLRKRKTKNGRISLFLAYWDPDHTYQVTRGKNKGKWKKGCWKYDFLKLYLEKNITLNKETLRLAESIRARKQIELQTNRHGFKSKTKTHASFIDYFKTFIKDTSQGNDRRSTLRKIEKFANGYLSFDMIDSKWLNSFRSYLLENLSQNTARRYLENVKYVLKKAEENNYIDFDPGKKVSYIKKLDSPKVYLSSSEIKALEKAPCRNDTVKKAFLFGCYTGLRISDLRRLKRNDINEDEKGKFKIEFRQKKTKAYEYLPISQKAIDFVDLDILQPDDNIFPLPSTNIINRVLDYWIKAANINKHVRFHSARHTFATLGLTCGIDLYTMSKLLGHEDIATTQIYGKIVDKKKRDAVDLLPVD